MSTFLEITQNTVRECGITNGGPTAVTNQEGELLRFVNWVIQAHTDIQNRHNDWRWMRAGFTINTTSGDDSYAYGDATDDLTSSAITRFARWRLNDADDPPRTYLSSAGVATEGWLIYSPWNLFKRIYKIGTQNNSYPAHITVDSQDNLVLGPKPNGVYVVSGDYQRNAQVLAADGDTPEMPSQYHDLIMYRAMEKYAFYESAQEVLSRSQTEGNRLMRQLEGNQLPEAVLGEPMA